MKKLALALIAFAGCGPVRTEELIPRYVILTTIGPESPMETSIQRLAQRRWAEVFRFRSIERDRDAILEWLRKKQPTYCALIVPPGQIDAAFQLAFFEIACRVDDDPFPDFAWGYFPAADAPSLQLLMERLEAAEAKVERRLLHVTRFHPGASATEVRNDRLAWASNLPLRTLSLKDGDLESLRKNLMAVEECDFLLLEGEGAPDGLRGLPREELDRLRLDGTIVFSGAAYTGVAGASFDSAADLLRRRTFDPEQSFAQTLLRRGAAAILAPLDRTEPRLIEREWTDAILSDEPLGWVMKHSYDLAVLSSGATAPTFELPRDASKAPAGFGGPLVQAATRILIGDPMLKLFSRQHASPLRYVSTQRATDREGRAVLSVTYRVGAWDCAGFFADPRGGDPEIHLKIPLPRDTSRAQAALTRAEAPGKAVEARLVASAVEQWRGDSILHVLVQGKALALEDLVLSFQITLDR
jgi:hypothetical protein